MSETAEMNMNPLQKQALDDTFDAFSMLARGSFVSLMHIAGGYTRYSPGAVELFNLPGEYIENGAMDWFDRLHPEDRKRYMDVMAPLISGDITTYDITYRVRVKDGSYSLFRSVGAVLRGDDGNPSMIGGMMINEGLVENTDPLTVLQNQYAFFADLPARLKSGSTVTAILIGINGIDNINAVNGYGHGNRVLQQSAWLIQESVRDRGAIYRMNGAKFAIVSDTISDQEAAAMYDAIRVKLQRGIRIGHKRHNLITSGGMISVQGAQMDVDTIYSCLYFAYRESKTRRYGDLVNYNGRSATGANELDMINAIRASVLEGCNGFLLRYQLVYDLDTGKPLGAESLIRWHADPYGEIFPLKFIPVLEQDYIFEELVAWILRQSMTDGKKLLEKDPELRIGVNISSAQVQDEYFFDTLDQILKSTGFPPHNLSLELTKSCRLLDTELLVHFAENLHVRGIEVVLDDFGTGYDSLGCLRALNADLVKFDRSLLDGLEGSAEDAQALGHLAELAALYSKHICAKGVDSENMRDILRKLPFSCMQGYLYSQPLPVEELLDGSIL